MKRIAALVLGCFFVSVSEPPLAQSAGPLLLDRFSDTIQQIASQTSPNVVRITTARTESPARVGFPPPEGRNPPPESQQMGIGSGVLLRGDLQAPTPLNRATPPRYILTNAHVIQNMDYVQVWLDEKTPLETRVVGSDLRTDVALLELTSPLPEKFQLTATGVPWGDSARTHVGDFVIAIGSPFGLSRTVTSGMISAKERRDIGLSDVEEFIQTDAAINPGSSGGPLLNSQGQLIGLNTAIFSQDGSFAGISLAIPSNLAFRISQELKANGRIIRGWMGVAAQSLNSHLAEYFSAPTTRGVLITDLVPHSPASKVLQVGDVITRMDNLDLPDPDSMKKEVQKRAPLSQIKLDISRQGKPLSVSIVLQEAPDSLNSVRAAGRAGQAAPRLEPARRKTPEDFGFEVGDPEESWFATHPLVRIVKPGGIAHRSGLIPGDEILSINRTQVEVPKDVPRIMKLSRTKEPTKALIFEIQRGQAQKLFIALHEDAKLGA